MITSTMVVGSKEKRQQMDLDDPLRYTDAPMHLSSTRSVSQAILSFPDLLEMPDPNRFTSSPKYSVAVATTSSCYSTDILSTTKYYHPAAPRMPLQEVWLVSPQYCPKCSKIPRPWSRKLRLHKVCNSWAEAGTILNWTGSISPVGQVDSTRGDMEGEEEILLEIIFRNGEVDCRTEVEKKLLEEGKSVSFDKPRSARRWNRKLSKSTDLGVVEMVHVEKVSFGSSQDIDKAVSPDPSVNTSSLENEKILDYPGIKKNMVKIQSDTDPPELEMIQPPQDSPREMIVALEREEYKISEMNQELRKILQRKRKTEEKERECEEEVAEVRRELKSLKREMRKMRKYNFL